VGREYSAYSWLPLSIGPLTRNFILGTQLQVLKLPLYELSVKALTTIESLATIGVSPTALYAIGLPDGACDRELVRAG
jgi:hypothetical protein